MTLLDRLDFALNPIAVKELRQEFMSDELVLKVSDPKQKPDTFKGVLVLSAPDPGEGIEANPARSEVAV